ncbi:regulator of nonsense transcripts UPF2 [Micractinium conductrix]|uniref:Regulator of nonsense transcripts UPF2 n=1 Tax=Micractinium conductrix TaxID=554055 RepID=A0A2P6VAD3_9CHLO|nr:regulator of nonsense transcripts UPF2 [Micractinium conductrix]|eukprot:PSC71053.1 regulator of nonsense transcripts UPF2 [Micractinium conductrix]
MKRNQAVIRKLRTALSEESRASLLQDIEKTNQSKYVSEVVGAICEAPLKLKDATAALVVCSALHQRYADFGQELVATLARLCTAADNDRGMGLPRKRAVLRLLVDLLLTGVYTAHAVLLTCVKQLAGSADFQRDPEGAQGALGLLTALAKAGREELLGLAPALPVALAPDSLPSGESGAGSAEAAAAEAYRKAVQRYEAALAARYCLPPEVQVALRTGVERCFQGACVALVAAHATLQETEAENARVLNNRGDLPEDMAAAYETQRKGFEGLQRAAAALAEVLDRPLPELRQAVTRIVAVADDGAAQAGDASAQQVFEDEETRAFYESLVDVRAVVPAVLLGDKPGGKEEGGTAGGEAGNGEAAGGAGAAAAAAGEKPRGGLQASASSASVESGGVSGGTGKEREMSYDDLLEGKGAEEPREPSQLDLLQARLPGCVSKELADELAVNFCYMQNKGARRRLARALASELPVGALALLPYYARIAATLAQVFPDVSQGVVSYLESEFATLQRSKDATIRTLEPRVRNMRYVGELAKFRVFPHGAAFSMLKGLLDDFSGHNIDAACALVETAGRFFYRLPETSTRMANFLEVMMKLRNARNLDARQSSLVDSAYFAVRAADRAPKRRQRPPEKEYIRHLIYERLPGGQVTKVLKKLRRLPWAAHERYLVKTLLRASHKGRFSQIPHLASLASGLARYHPSFGIALVDEVLEAVEAGLETPDAGFYQRRVAAVRLLGELYNYKLVNSHVIFATLHLILAYGHEPSTPPEVTRRLDPPNNYFRIRLVCGLLGACGQFFSRGAPRRKLDTFLPYLQRYLLAKPPLPLDVEFDVQDLWDHLKVSPPHYESYEAACAAVADIEAAQAAAAASGLAAVEEEEEEEEGDGLDDGGSGGEEEGDEEDEEEGGEADEDDEGPLAGEADEEEEDVRMVRPASAQPVEVDEDFEREFSQLMMDFQGRAAGSAAARGGGPGGGPAAGHAASAPVAGLPAQPPAAAAGGGGAEAGGGKVAFRVMMKRGGREDRTRELRIPVTAGMAALLAQKEAAEAAEKAELKRLVLEANKRDLQEQQEALRAAQLAGRQRGQGARGYYGRGGGGGGGGRGGGGRGLL